MRAKEPKPLMNHNYDKSMNKKRKAAPRFQAGGRLLVRLFPKTRHLATSITCPMLTAPAELWMPAGTHQRPPQRGVMVSPEDSLEWAQSCQTHLGMAGRHPDGGVREHPLLTTLGRQARDSPHQVPSPWTGNQRLLNPIWHELFWTVSHGGGGGDEGLPS